MNWTVSIIVCAVCLVIWLAATIGEKKLRKKRDKLQGDFSKRPGVYYGRDHNHDSYK